MLVILASIFLLFVIQSLHFEVATTSNETVVIPLQSSECPGFWGNGRLARADIQVIMRNVTIEAAVLA